jgi:hypothetical protein
VLNPYRQVSIFLLLFAQAGFPACRQAPGADPPFFVIGIGWTMNLEYRIQEARTWNYFFRLILISWIIFAIYMYPINTFFFGITIFLSAILFIISFNRQELILTSGEIILKNKRIIRTDKIVRKIILKDIRDCTLEKIRPTSLTWFLNFINYLPGTLRTENYLIFRHKNNSLIGIKTFGSEKENTEILDRIKNYLQQKS